MAACQILVDNASHLLVDADDILGLNYLHGIYVNGFVCFTFRIIEPNINQVFALLNRRLIINIVWKWWFLIYICRSSILQDVDNHFSASSRWRLFNSWEGLQISSHIWQSSCLSFERLPFLSLIINILITFYLLNMQCGKAAALAIGNSKLCSATYSAQCTLQMSAQDFDIYVYRVTFF